MTSDEFASMIGRNDRFAMLLVEVPKIFVIGDEVEFEIKKGVLASGTVTHVTPKRVQVKVHEAAGDTTAPTNAINVTFSAPEQDPLADEESDYDE